MTSFVAFVQNWRRNSNFEIHCDVFTLKQSEPRLYGVADNSEVQPQQMSG